MSNTQLKAVSSFMGIKEGREVLPKEYLKHVQVLLFEDLCEISFCPIDSEMENIVVSECNSSEFMAVIHLANDLARMLNVPLRVVVDDNSCEALELENVE